MTSIKWKNCQNQTAEQNGKVCEKHMYSLLKKSGGGFPVSIILLDVKNQ